MKVIGRSQARGPPTFIADSIRAALRRGTVAEFRWLPPARVGNPSLGRRPTRFLLPGPFPTAPLRTGRDTFASSGSPGVVLQRFRDRRASRPLLVPVPLPLPPFASWTAFPSSDYLRRLARGYPVPAVLRRLRHPTARTQ